MMGLGRFISGFPFSVSIAQSKKSVKQAAFVEKIAALLAFPPQICYTNHIDFTF
jgi:hypothetical protein